jgi:GTP cyclohydrolase II
MAAPLRRLASAQVPVHGTVMQMTVFGTRAGTGEREEVVAVRTLAPPEPDKIPLVRVHSACFTGDVLGSSKCDCGMQLGAALDIIGAYGDGALLYLLRQEGRGIGLANKIRAYALQTVGHDTVSANLALGLPVEQRDFRIAATCLRMLGMTRVRLLTNNPQKIQGLSRHGVRVESRVPLGGFRTGENEGYLAVKDRHMGHLGALGVAGVPLPVA